MTVHALAFALKPGDPIHIGPHDVPYGDHTLHLDTPDLDVEVEAATCHGRVVIIYWITRTGRPCGVCVYGASDLIPLLERAA